MIPELLAAFKFDYPFLGNLKFEFSRKLGD